MDSNNTFPVLPTSKPSVTQVYHDSFHQALSLRPATMGVPREIDERDLFLMSQIQSTWGPRTNFMDHQPPLNLADQQQSTSSHIYGVSNHPLFHPNVPGNVCQPLPHPPADLDVSIPHQNNQGQQAQLQQQVSHGTVSQEQCAAETAAGVVSQLTTESILYPSNHIQQPPAKKRKRTANTEQTAGPKSKRSANPAEWKKRKKKVQRDKGEEYTRVGGRVQKARCVQAIDCTKCRFRCSDKVPEDAREAIHNLYWSLASYERQRAFIAQHVEQNDIKQVRSKTSSRREVAHTFYLVHKRQEHRVCKNFFTKTLDITNKLVDYTMKRTESGVYTGRDERGRRDPVNKTKPEDSEFIRWHIDSFPTAATVGRAKKDGKNKNLKRHLSSDLNVGKMYSMYKDLCERSGRKPMGISVYRAIFKQDFNLAFTKPKKEHCVNCKCDEGTSKKKKKGVRAAKNMPSTSLSHEQPVLFQ